MRDYDEAIGWFGRCLGCRLAEDTPLGGTRRWVVMAPAHDGQGASLLLARAEGERQRAAVGNQAGGRVGFFLYTKDFARKHAAMLAAGVDFREAPRRERYGTVAVFADLYGNLWDLLEPSGPPA